MNEYLLPEALLGEIRSCILAQLFVMRFLFFIRQSAFYPVQNIPEALRALFYLNPLTYVVDILRAGFFSQVTSFTNIEVVLLTLFSAIALAIAIRSIMGMNDSQVSTQV